MKPNEQEDRVFRETSMLSESHKIVLAVGRLHRAKGFDLLIEAFALTQARFPGWRLVILGAGPQKKSLQSKIEQLGLAATIFLPGFSTAPRATMKKSDIFVLSSRYEGMPNALMEAMSEGLACVSFDCRTGPSELIEQDVSGLLVAPENVLELSGALSRLMSSADERNSLGQHAVLTTRKFNPQSIHDKWFHVIRGVLASNGSIDE